MKRMLMFGLLLSQKRFIATADQILSYLKNLFEQRKEYQNLKLKILNTCQLCFQKLMLN